ncbi:MAG: minichromosome maintenance protein MCM, partial [Sulfolobales archaeon]
TAAVIKEKQSGEYFLEAGAMVLADGGTVCIDEIDKMRDEDRVAIHEAMEQGTVSIAKAGIVARLNARASVLAAGNPKYGRYIPSRPIAENINLPITILSRFDLIFTLRDLTNLDRDKSLVRHVLKSHESIEEVRPEIPPDILRKYIAYARKYVKPKLTKEAEILIEEFYLEMRKKSAETPEAPIAITTRQLEALVRLAEAHARMALKNYVDAEDAAEAIRLMNVMLENVGIDLETGHIDIDVIMTGKPKSVRDKELIIKDIIRELSSESDCAKIKDVVKEAVKRGIDEEFVEKYLMSLRRVGELYEVRTGCINFID